MSRLADDITLLARAADIAAKAIYPELQLTVSSRTLDTLADELMARRGMPADYVLIGDEAVMMMQCARNLVLCREDRDAVKVERWRRLGELFAAAVALDLNNARKSLGEVA